MSEEDFFANQGNQYRGSRYPSFSSGGLTAGGNLSGIARTTNPATYEGQELSSVSEVGEAPQADIPEIPSAGEALGSAALQAGVPFLGSTIGRTAGTALGAGAPIGEALSAGVGAVGRRVSGLLGSGSGSTAGSTAANAVSSEATAVGIEGTVGQQFSSAGNLGSAAGAGIATAGIGLLTGQEPKKAVGAGLGTAAGQAIGSALGSAVPIVGTAIGGFIGGAIGGSIGGRVVCSELVRQGHMKPEDQLLDMHYTMENLSSIHARGYFFWAYGYVRKMQREDWVGRLYTRVARWIAISRMEEIKYQVGLRDKPNYLGKIVRWIGEPLCYAIGYLLEDSPHSRLYNRKENTSWITLKE